MGEVVPSREWYSAKLRFACLVEGEGAVQFRDSVVLVMATSFRHAFARTLDVGRAHEQEYRNGAGRRVVWRLKEVLTVDFAAEAELDGVEVFCEPVELREGESYPLTLSSTLRRPNQRRPSDAHRPAVVYRRR